MAAYLRQGPAMPRSASDLSRRRLLGGLAGLSAALLPGAALAASPSPVSLLPARPAITPRLPIPPGVSPGPAPTPAPAAPAASPPAAPAAPAVERWLQNHSATNVWADPEGTRALAPAAQWSYFRIA